MTVPPVWRADLAARLDDLAARMRPAAFVRDGDTWMRNADGQPFRLLDTAPELERAALRADPGFHARLLARHADADMILEAAAALRELERLTLQGEPPSEGALQDS